MVLEVVSGRWLWCGLVFEEELEVGLGGYFFVVGFVGRLGCVRGGVFVLGLESMLWMGGGVVGCGFGVGKGMEVGNRLVGVGVV